MSNEKETIKVKDLEIEIFIPGFYGSYNENGGDKDKYVEDKYYKGKYTGEINNGKPHGYGIFLEANYYNNDDGYDSMDYDWEYKYEGRFKDGLFHGKGEFTVDNPFICYKGNFKDGKYNGLGYIYHDSNDYYDYNGNFLNGEFHDKNAKYRYFILDDSDTERMLKGHKFDNVEEIRIIYNGEFKNGNKNGYGELVKSVKCYGDNYDYETYKGAWENNNKHGKGILRQHTHVETQYIPCSVRQTERTEIDYVKYETYETTWINGKMNGACTFISENGGKYEGNMKDNEKYGLFTTYDPK